jgi:hypothetical protein
VEITGNFKVEIGEVVRAGSSTQLIDHLKEYSQAVAEAAAGGI